MNLKYLKEISLLGLGIVVIFGGITYLSRESEKQTPNSTQSEIIDDAAVQITLSIDGVYENKLVSVEKDETILGVLETLDDKDENLQLGTKSYGELGVLVESIGGIVNGTNDKYWQYSVNGVAPMIGADAYTLEGGETVLWKFKASEF